MSNLTDFFPSGGGGLTPKFQEFNASGTFTPTQALIDAGGYIEVFLVGGGGRTGNSYSTGASGGEVLMKKMYLTSVSSLMVGIGSGGATSAANGGDSYVIGPTESGVNLTAGGGYGNYTTYNLLTAGWGSRQNTAAGSGTLGYGAGATADGGGSGVRQAKANSGSASYYSNDGGSGYCLIKWYE